MQPAKKNEEKNENKENNIIDSLKMEFNAKNQNNLSYVQGNKDDR